MRGTAARVQAEERGEAVQSRMDVLVALKAFEAQADCPICREIAHDAECELWALIKKLETMPDAEAAR